MLNYANLNDVEFEYLCQDIMQEMLKTPLRRFAKGKDGGIDLVDTLTSENIVIQVKHYVNSSVDVLFSSLKKELEKIQKIRPKQYYICCSKELSPQKVKEIYELFVDFMESDKNIITIIEIEDFLQKPENNGILLKHYKLWLDSIGVLENLSNNDIFIDCETLLANIESDKKFFVRTKVFDKCLDCLAHNKTLFITGNPGVGKTITSKMLIIHYAANGYKVRYTTNSSDLKELKKSLSRNPELKEIILIDDCFGQAYFEMKGSQNDELLSLIKYVNLSNNKLLVLNSRVTIFQEAKEQKPELIRSLENGEYKVFIIDMNAMTIVEKAKIFYNHLYFNNTKQNYLKVIKEDKNYLKIISHPNYNPRLIEFICNPNRYKGIHEKNYFKYIQSHLNNPKQIWKDEYERKLQKPDRIFLSTLYSLSDKEVDKNLLNECFNHAISNEQDIDLTINQFEASMLRLVDSFIKIIDNKGYQLIAVLNPSINDYIEGRLKENEVEKQAILRNSLYITQLQRILVPDDFYQEMITLVANHQLDNLLFESTSQKHTLIAYCIAKGKICDLRYKNTIFSYLKNPTDFTTKQIIKRPLNIIIRELFNDKLYEFYGIHEFLIEHNGIQDMLSSLEFDDVIALVDIIEEKIINLEDRKIFIEIATEEIKSAIEAYYDNVDISNFIVDIGPCIESAYSFDGEYLDEDSAVEHLKERITELAIDYIEKQLHLLPKDIIISDDFLCEIPITVYGASDAVQEYLSDYSNYDSYDDEQILDKRAEIDEVDFIFDHI